MNISPSDVEVRQGYSPADEVAAVMQSAALPQKPVVREALSQPEQDPQSMAAIAAADRQVAKDTAEKLSKHLEGTDTALKIRLIDNSQNGVQVEILDKGSNKVLRKIPQDELIKLSASIKTMTGVFLNKST
ncbi:MAG: flagellar protein FlaG [Proteobacteria bacterium]|nr:flagellar protein FlaG [Pseudomonadota bacterium]MBU1594229.1 flagellar protein FlaG [Pseudomonadota bacterium]